jgi:hypothetical protein
VKSLELFAFLRREIPPAFALRAVFRFAGVFPGTQLVGVTRTFRMISTRTTRGGGAFGFLCLQRGAKGEESGDQTAALGCGQVHSETFAFALGFEEQVE